VFSAEGRVISSWLPGERGAGGGYQVYLESTNNIGKFEVIMLWEGLVTVLHKETLPDICIGIPCNGHVTFYQTSKLNFGEKSKYIAKHRRHFMMSQKSD
jgi:hypothetical protein